MSCSVAVSCAAAASLWLIMWLWRSWKLSLGAVPGDLTAVSVEPRFGDLLRERCARVDAGRVFDFERGRCLRLTD